MLSILNILNSENQYMSLNNINTNDKIIGWGNILNTIISKDLINVFEHPIYKNELIIDDKTELKKLRIYILNDIPVCLTSFQPIMTTDGWKSINPIKTLEYQSQFGLIGKLQIGDILFIYDEKQSGCYKCIELKTIKQKQLIVSNDNVQLYNITVLGNHSYHVNGLVIHCLTSCDSQQQSLLNKINQLSQNEIVKLKEFFIKNFKDMQNIMGIENINTIAKHLGIKIDV